MKHLRRVSTAIAVAVFSAGLVTMSASGASADDGVSAKKNTGTVSVSRARDSSWG